MPAGRSAPIWVGLALAVVDQRRFVQMGVDSLIVLILYAIGVAGLFAIAAGR